MSIDANLNLAVDLLGEFQYNAAEELPLEFTLQGEFLLYPAVDVSFDIDIVSNLELANNCKIDFDVVGYVEEKPSFKSQGIDLEVDLNLTFTPHYYSQSILKIDSFDIEASTLDTIYSTLNFDIISISAINLPGRLLYIDLDIWTFICNIHILSENFINIDLRIPIALSGVFSIPNNIYGSISFNISGSGYFYTINSFSVDLTINGFSCYGRNILGIHEYKVDTKNNIDMEVFGVCL